jgi:hypothetical protein
MPTTYTIRRAKRPKIGNPLFTHHGTQILAIGGQKAAYRWFDKRGLMQEIPQPIIDFGCDQKVCMKTQEQFASGNQIEWADQIDVQASEFEQRYQKVLQDVRPYSVALRDCESTADTLIEGKPQHRQAWAWAVGIVAFVAICAALRE